MNGPRLRPVTLRAATLDDERFLSQIYAATRSSELAMVAWTETEKSAFVELQFRAQDQYYREHYSNTSFDVIASDGQSVGRL